MKYKFALKQLSVVVCFLLSITGQPVYADTISTNVTQDGGVLTTSDGFLIVGNSNANNPATLTLINGAQTTVTDEFLVGANGDFDNPEIPTSTSFGTVEILGGSSLNTHNIVAIGLRLNSNLAKPSGELTVSGTDSIWTVTGGVIAGFGGDSKLTIANGGTVTTPLLNLGASQIVNFGNTSSSLSVTGPGSKLISTDLDVSANPFSSADLTISNSATVEVSNKLSTNMAGVVNMNGGKLTVKTLDNDGTINLNDGVISTDSLTNKGMMAINGGTLIANEIATKGPLNINDGKIILDRGGYKDVNESYAANIVINGNSSSANPTFEFRSTQTQQMYYSITVGDDRNGSLVIKNATQIIFEKLQLGKSSGGNGTLDVEGGTVNVWYDRINIGSASRSNGVVNIKNGANVGAGFIVGDQGTGTLNILSGSAVSSGSPTDTNTQYSVVTIGNSAGSLGDVIVAGENTEWKTGNLEVGREGVGTLLIHNGAQVETANAFIGGSTINTRAFSITRGMGNSLVTGENSAWSITGILGVGYYQGKLEVLDGAKVTCDSGYVVAAFVDAVSKTVISGEESTLEAIHGFIVGSYESDIANFSLRPIDGNANLLVENGAHLISRGNFNDPRNIGGLLVLHGGTLTGDGGFIVGNVSNWGGIVSPGSSPGIMTIEGNYTQQSFPAFRQTGGHLQIELAGLSQGISYDFLHVTGLTTLDGLLDLSLLDGFEHSILSTDTFTVLTSDGGLTGGFTNVGSDHRLDTRWGSFLVSYDAHSVILSDFVAVPEADSLLLTGLGVVAAIGIASRRRRSALLN